MEQNFAIMSSSIHKALGFNASTKYLVVECEHLFLRIFKIELNLTKARNLLKLFIGYFFLQTFLFVLEFEVTKA